MRATHELVVGEGTDDLIGRTVGGYVIQSRIGKGGMGAVYLGVHPTLDRKVAVKVLLARHVADDELMRRFVDEARAASSIQHPAVVQVHDLARLPDGRAYILMEHLEGETVSALLKRRGKLEPAEAVALVREALGGLAAAHARGIVHRDVKPANLFVTTGGQVKVLDFGIAKLHRDPEQSTASGVVLGTPEYMAPEQASGVPGSVGPACDVYAAGIVLYELLSGTPPFRSADWAHVLVLHRTESVPPIEGIPRELDVVLRRALSKDPALRYADARAMQAALGGDADTPVTRDLRARPVPKRRRWPLAVVPAAVAAIAIGAYVLWPTSPTGRAASAPPPAADAQPAPTESCVFEVTDLNGTVHRHGGARVQIGDRPGALIGVFLGDDIWQFMCHSTDTPLGKTWVITTLVPRDHVKPGATVPGDGYPTLGFQSMPPPGFDKSYYHTPDSAEISFTQASLMAGAPIAGELTASYGGIRLRASFDFKNE